MTAFTFTPNDAESKYVYNERLGILMDGAEREPTLEEIAMAKADVLRFNQERERDREGQRDLI